MQTKLFIKSLLPAIFILVFVGLVISAMLHIEYSSENTFICGYTADVSGCETVKNSEYSYLFGIRLPVLGVAFFSTFLLLSGLGVFVQAGYLRTQLFKDFFKGRLYSFSILLLGLVGAFVEVYLLFIQHVILKEYCSWCLLLGIVALVVFVLSNFYFFSRNYFDK
ncbi:hypothetical protein H6802_03190 [Candidatus Nomurabacteria bacterium]|uniref:Vitamin K epoxide reductase domain-containing protein n=1 Tax=candidate division WWE3 bacterium TaxID=2053526 RepID=A0A955E148_UNCKA|nr:hypothetical protein [candidate division WWE3 bacterium]MCB9823935.1 hypothetical protein [Candidatus Nomurabacteria bacterium]MCB9827084.1 hypothetical protein [Candidatus Nomurabacteria bacterium]MCB9827874.1 hypothetical protein [Candidatus Nomurabacteria bacterium]HXK53044.1 vitamin K epoxide reductase family protein [bacterium]